MIFSYSKMLIRHLSISALRTLFSLANSKWSFLKFSLLTTDWSSSLSANLRVLYMLFSLIESSLFLVRVASRLAQISWYSVWARSQSFSSFDVCSLRSSFYWLSCSSFLLVWSIVSYLAFIYSIRLVWSFSAWRIILSSLVLEDSSWRVSFSSCLRVFIESSKSLFRRSHSFSFLVRSYFNCFN